MTSLQRRLSLRAHLLACALTLSACTSGIQLADQACSPNRMSAAAFADCLRRNYATLTSGPFDEGDLGGLYLAAAEYQASLVSSGRESDAQAMLELADFRMKVLTPVEQKRRQDAMQKMVDALQSGQNQGGSGAPQANHSQARSSSR